ncbi:hypothetical protein C4J91_4392 [Pseudomonas sp. R3-52-08]|nr:hypothetical protein C4J91_4392 [Pseudomonas sp. R3-52-08]
MRPEGSTPQPAFEMQKSPAILMAGLLFFQRVTQNCGSPTCRIFMPLVPPVV